MRETKMKKCSWLRTARTVIAVLQAFSIVTAIVTMNLLCSENAQLPDLMAMLDTNDRSD